MRELIDLDRDINEAFPGVILGVSQKGGKCWVNHWHKNITDERKAEVNTFIENYNWGRESAAEIKAKADAEFRANVALIAASLKEKNNADK